CGVGVIDSAGARRATLVAAGVVRSSADEPIDQRLLAIVGGVRQAFEEHSPDVVAVERVFSQNNISTVMGTVQVSVIAILEAIEEHSPDVVAVERVFSQNNISTVMGTAQVSGIAILEAAERGIPIAMHTPSEVKAAVTGNGRADKKQIQAMLVKLLKLEAPPRPADAADAVAIALTQLWRGPGPVALDATGGARTSAQSVWAEAERSARRARAGSTSRT